MKKLAAVLLLTSLAAGCGSNLYACDRTFSTVGFISEKEKGIQYKPIMGNWIWMAILVETIIAPVYFLGFSVYEPVSADCKEIGKK